MLNLTNVFKLVVYRPNDSPLAQEDFIYEAHELIGHVYTPLGQFHIPLDTIFTKVKTFYV